MSKLYLKIVRKIFYLIRMSLFKMTYKPYKRVSKVKSISESTVLTHTFSSDREYVVAIEVVCQHSIYEWNKYPRPGIKIMKLKPHDVVKFEGTYENDHAKYYRFKKYSSPGVLENYEYDISVNDARHGIRTADDLTGGW